MLKPLALIASLLLLASPACADDPAPVAASETAAADDVPQAVKDACKGDYEKNCSMHAPGTPAVRECMARAFEKLSDGCVTAILDSSLADTAAEDVAKVQQASQRSSEDKAPDADKPKAHVAKLGAAPGKHTAGKGHARSTKLAKADGHVSKRHTAKAATHVVRPAPVKRPVEARAKSQDRERHYAQHQGKKKGNVAGYIQKGTSIANYYVAKYTRFALAKAFH